MDDNVYPASSKRFVDEPEAQKARRMKEQEEFLAEKPLIAKVVKNLEERIRSLHDIDAITETKDMSEFMRQVAVNKAVALALNQELGRLEAIIKTHSKK